MTADFTPIQEKILVDHLVSRVVRQASGDFIIRPGTLGFVTDRLVSARPKDKFFIGQLKGRPDPAKLEEGTLDKTKIKPNAQKIRFQVRKGQIPHLRVNTTFSVFYRVVPTYEEHILAVFRPGTAKKRNRDELALEELDDELVDEGVEAHEEPTRREKGERIARTYRRLDLKCGPVDLDLDDLESGMGELAIKIREEIERAREIATQDDRRFTLAHLELELSDRQLEDADNFEAAIDVAGQAPPVEWDVNLSVESKHVSGDVYDVTIVFENLAMEDHNDEISENSLFSPVIECSVLGGKIVPYKFHLLPSDFRSDRTLWAHALNCSFELSADHGTIRTTHAPKFNQKRFLPRETGPVPSFRALAADPIPLLKEIAGHMDQYLEEAWPEKRPGSGSDDPHHAAWIEARKKFSNEIIRFRAGIGALEDKQELLYSFKTMNDVMAKNAAGSYDAWRMFQIVFIVSMIPHIAAREWKEYERDAGQPSRDVFDIVDIIYFPTGGGKTEAYLGLIVLAAFFDRKRGKSFGLTAWARFPLRLLGLQQFQRIVSVFHHAENVRKREGLEGDSFTVGLFVGKGSTPNDLSEQNLAEFREADDLLQKNRFVHVCPECGNHSIRLEVDVDAARIYHYCTNGRSGICKTDRLNVVISDEEVYRRLPTVLVGTVDKLALIGMQVRAAMLLGRATHRCARHGYALKSGCIHKGCKQKVTPIEDPYDLPPSLMIQDELHLLREGLGTFDSHYEGFLEEVLRRSHPPVRVKIIAATATIESYEHQVEHLYRKTARRFPEEGPELGSNYYAATRPETRRAFVGILPFGVTQIQALMDLLFYYHREVQRLQEDPQALSNVPGLQGLSDETARELLLAVEPSLSYFTSKSEADRVSTSIEAQVNAYLGDEGYRPLKPASLTGETMFEEVNEILANLEQPPENHEERIHTITATSMVSHGVDVERLNAMFFFGMPRVTAEYIQSSSRVGRSYTGAVFLLYNPARERDRSHYHMHQKYHEYLDRLVEPVAINRWSRFSLESTLPGIYMGYVLTEVQARRYGTSKSLMMYKNLKEAFTKGHIAPSEIEGFVLDCYGDGNPAFKHRAQDLVTKINKTIIENDHDFGQIGKFFTHLDPPLRIMTSLRDTDAAVPFRPLKEARAVHEVMRA